jgi:hypothetical protein
VLAEQQVEVRKFDPQAEAVAPVRRRDERVVLAREAVLHDAGAGDGVRDEATVRGLRGRDHPSHTAPHRDGIALPHPAGVPDRGLDRQVAHRCVGRHAGDECGEVVEPRRRRRARPLHEPVGARRRTDGRREIAQPLRIGGQVEPTAHLDHAEPGARRAQELLTGARPVRLPDGIQRQSGPPGRPRVGGRVPEQP